MPVTANNLFLGRIKVLIGVSPSGIAEIVSYD